MSSMHTKNFFEKAKKLIDELDLKMISSLAVKIAEVRKNNGRVFFIGVGGSAGNCSHAVNDFRKLCDIECYSPSDNVSELTARINDEGWENLTESEQKILYNASEKYSKTDHPN